MPGAAAAVHRELGGLEQQKLVVSQFWGPEVWNHGRRGASDDLTQAVPGSGDSWLVTLVASRVINEVRLSRCR